jgi:hypothetical protein
MAAGEPRAVRQMAFPQVEIEAEAMIEKTVNKLTLSESGSAKRDLAFWLSKPAEERVAAVDFLRRQYHGSRTRDLLALFNKHRVEYLIVGGYALAFHGAPRYTGDMDVWVRPNSANASRIMAALSEFGFGSAGLTAADFEQEKIVVQLGVLPVRVDIMTSLTGVSWEEAYSNREEGKYGDIPVFYIGRKQFITNKKATGRKRDLADLEALGEE